MIGTNIPVEELEKLANDIASQAKQIEGTLNAAHKSMTRDPSFTGSAANNYDSYLAKWSKDQADLLLNMRAAGTVLENLARITRENNDRTAQAFIQ